MVLVVVLVLELVGDNWGGARVDIGGGLMVNGASGWCSEWCLGWI